MIKNNILNDLKRAWKVYSKELVYERNFMSYPGLISLHKKFSKN